MRGSLSDEEYRVTGGAWADPVRSAIAQAVTNAIFAATGKHRYRRLPIRMTRRLCEAVKIREYQSSLSVRRF